MTKYPRGKRAEKRELASRPTAETHEAATVRMVNDPMSWPNLALPLKKWGYGSGPHGLPETAVLCASLEKPYKYVIYVGANIWMMDKAGEGKPTTADEVLRDGWLVD